MVHHHIDTSTVSRIAQPQQPNQPPQPSPFQLLPHKAPHHMKPAALMYHLPLKWQHQLHLLLQNALASPSACNKMTALVQSRSHRLQHQIYILGTDFHAVNAILQHDRHCSFRKRHNDILCQGCISNIRHT